MIEFTIPGEPTAQGRPRASTSRGRVQMYDPNKSRYYKEYVATIAKRHAPPKPLEGALKVTMVFYRPIPKGHNKSWVLDALEGRIRPITKPDCTNYAKGVEDALNGLIWGDDSQIVSLTIEKYYSNTPRVEIRVEQGRGVVLDYLAEVAD